jgi:excisionase family DNA binding protein
MPDLPEREMQKVRDVAGFLGVSVRVVYHRIARGQVPVVRTPGGGIRIPRAAITEVVEPSRRTSTTRIERPDGGDG